MLIPSIDLYNGQAVQWRQGKERVLERGDVEALLLEFSLYGEVALIDLNATLGEGNNRALIKSLLKLRRCRVGGGIRSLEIAQDYLKSGASKIIIGTAARENWVAQLPRDALIFAIDAKGDELVSNGWRESSGERVLSVLLELAKHCSEFLYTAVLNEGMLEGMDRDRIVDVVNCSPIPVTVAGGISSLDDIRYLRALGANAQIGMALYTGKLTLPDCLIASCDFAKQALLPTIVQDADSGEVLMLAYSTAESLRLALSEKLGVFWSRSRQQIWRKGEESGHTQKLRRVDFDCDGDSLLFQVEQTQRACHLQRWSCFGAQTRRFSLRTLDVTLMARQKSAPPSSYTAQLFCDEALRNQKLSEECAELIEACEPEHVRWEAADLLYFALVNARAKGVALQEIENELRARQR